MPPRFFDLLREQYDLHARSDLRKSHPDFFKTTVEPTSDDQNPVLNIKGTHGNRSIVAPLSGDAELLYGNASVTVPSNLGPGLKIDPAFYQEPQQERNFYRALTDPDLKRVLFDSNQALTFAATESGPPAHVQEMLFLPFDQTYLELTTGLTMADSEPPHAGDDVVTEDTLRAFMLDGSKRMVTTIPITPIGFDGMPSGPAAQRRVQIIQAVGLFASAPADYPPGAHPYQFVDRTWRFILETGQAMTPAGLARGTVDPSELPDDIDNATYVVCGEPMGIEERYVGWWERMLMALTELISWCLSYMMAKSIKIIPEPLSRQVRRNMARKNIPNPWHVVRVEPVIKPGSNNTGEGSGPSYRYDVQRHLRFNRHRLKDRTWKYTIELVPPHQRGLGNALYVPKISKFEGGKIPAREMEHYWGENPSA